MGKRVMVSLAAIGLFYLLTASAQKVQVHPTRQLAVYDADGKKVGPVAGAEYIYSQFVPLVPLTVDDVPFMLYVFRDGFVGLGTEVWESNDCSGTPLITVDGPGDSTPQSSITRVAIGLPGSTVYVPDGPRRTITIHSFSTDAVPGLDKRFPQPSQCTASGFVVPWRMSVVPARPLIDMNTQFKPPFTVR